MRRASRLPHSTRTCRNDRALGLHGFYHRHSTRQEQSLNASKQFCQSFVNTHQLGSWRREGLPASGSYSKSCSGTRSERPIMSSPQVVVVIPARYGSTRLPGKPLVSLGGKPMVQRVYERAKLARRVNRVIVATDDERIVKAVQGFGGEARMTRVDHRTGTERVAEVAAHESGDVFVNVQGDEPLLDPVAVDTAVNSLLEEPIATISTVAVLIRTPADIMDPNVVKTVLDFEDNAIYFSRAPIPWVRNRGVKSHARHLYHLGLYLYQRDALLQYPTLPQGELERIEQLEQLRWMENGWKIRVV